MLPVEIDLIHICRIFCLKLFHLYFSYQVLFAYEASILSLGQWQHYECDSDILKASTSRLTNSSVILKASTSQLTNSSQGCHGSRQQPQLAGLCCGAAYSFLQPYYLNNLGNLHGAAWQLKPIL